MIERERWTIKRKNWRRMLIKPIHKWIVQNNYLRNHPYLTTTLMTIHHSFQSKRKIASKIHDARHELNVTKSAHNHVSNFIGVMTLKGIDSDIFHLIIL